MNQTDVAFDNILCFRCLRFIFNPTDLLVSVVSLFWSRRVKGATGLYKSVGGAGATF